MEAFLGMMCKAMLESHFDFHWRYCKVQLSHLYFANDRMIFSKTTQPFADYVVMGVLFRLAIMSDFRVNLSKSEIFFGATEVHIQDVILELHRSQERATSSSLFWCTIDKF